MTHSASTHTIESAVAALGPGELTEARVREHLWPLFSRVLDRRDETGVVYLANHSLGRPLNRTAEDVQRALDHWYRDLDGAWEPWSDAMTRYRAMNARLIGCAREDAVVHKVSAGQGLRTVLNTIEPKRDRPRVLTTRGEFDACDFILKRYAAKGRIDLDWVDADEHGRFDADAIAERVTDAHDLVVVSMVFYATGQHLAEVQTVIDAAHTHGALVMLDTYHQAGVMPMDFDGSRADFAIGGNYKYTRGGSGACWLAVRDDHLDDPNLQPIDTGWFAKADHFGFQRDDVAHLAAGGDGWQEGTPALLCMVQALAGLEFTLAVGVDRLRAYNVHQRRLLADAIYSAGGDPINGEPRGAFLLMRVEDLAYAIDVLRAEAVVADGRPDSRGIGHVRFCPDLLTTEEEIDRAAQTIARVCHE
ncbi:MAG: aminotransferase class V-fold PLP-dependent enzyme [Planctomycetota bacterium]